MAPKSRAWDKVYEWSNYRLACSLMNARKKDFSDVPDPIEIEDGWFHIELVGFGVVPSVELDEATRNRLQLAIDERLRLNDRAFRRRRELDATRYWEKQITFDVLMEESPFVARELRRQGRLLGGS